MGPRLLRNGLWSLEVGRKAVLLSWRDQADTAVPLPGLFGPLISHCSCVSCLFYFEHYFRTSAEAATGRRARDSKLLKQCSDDCQG